MTKCFKGLWPAMFTPVDENGEPEYAEMEKLVELLVGQEMDGLYILGSTGQGVLFTEQQRKDITEAVMRFVAGRLPVMAQVGALTTDESVRLARHAEENGAVGISSVGPIYYSGTADMALKHYQTIAESTRLPFFPYQLGDHSIQGNTISFVERLLDIQNVTGMKLTTNQLLDISAIHNYAGNRLKLFSGSDELFCHASLCGTVGAIGSTYNLWGTSCKKIMATFINGGFEEAKRFMLVYQDVIKQILPNIWPFLRSAMKIQYKIDIGPTKAPLANTQTEWDTKEVESILEKIEEVSVMSIPVEVSKM